MVRSGDLGGHLLVGLCKPNQRLGNRSFNKAVVARLLCGGAPSCCHHISFPSIGFPMRINLSDSIPITYSVILQSNENLDIKDLLILNSKNKKNFKWRRSTAEVPCKYRPSTFQVPQNYRRRTAEVLRDYCLSSTELSPKYRSSIAHYQSNTQVRRKYRLTIAKVPRNYRPTASQLRSSTARVPPIPHVSTA